MTATGLNCHNPAPRSINRVPLVNQSGSKMRVTRKAQMKRTGLLAVAMAAIMGSALAGTAAKAEEDCNWYALQSAKQQQTNEQKSCGLTGDGWTTDKKALTDYCESVSPEEWGAALKARQKLLEACG